MYLYGLFFGSCLSIRSLLGIRTLPHSLAWGKSWNETDKNHRVFQGENHRLSRGKSSKSSTNGGLSRVFFRVYRRLHLKIANDAEKRSDFQGNLIPSSGNVR